MDISLTPNAAMASMPPGLRLDNVELEVHNLNGKNSSSTSTRFSSSQEETSLSRKPYVVPHKAERHWPPATTAPPSGVRARPDDLEV